MRICCNELFQHVPARRFVHAGRKSLSGAKIVNQTKFTGVGLERSEVLCAIFPLLHPSKSGRSETGSSSARHPQ
jgi:hypothetical protein